MPRNLRADFFLLTETKYKIFIPRKETARATGENLLLLGPGWPWSPGFIKGILFILMNKSKEWLLFFAISRQFSKREAMLKHGIIS